MSSSTKKLKLWQMAIMSWINEKLMTRSRQDQAALHLLGKKLFVWLVCTFMPLVMEYQATPILTTIQGSQINAEIQKLVNAGYLVMLKTETEVDSHSW